MLKAIGSVGYDDHCFCYSWIHFCDFHWVYFRIGRSNGCLHYYAQHSDFGYALWIWIWNDCFPTRMKGFGQSPSCAIGCDSVHVLLHDDNLPDSWHGVPAAWNRTAHHHLSTVALLFLLENCEVAVVLLLLVRRSDIREVLLVPIVHVGEDHPDGRDVEGSRVGAMGAMGQGAHDHGSNGHLERVRHLLLDLEEDVVNFVPIGRESDSPVGEHRWNAGLDSKRTLPVVLQSKNDLL